MWDEPPSPDFLQSRTGGMNRTMALGPGTVKLA